eukprot:125557_1
MSDSNKREKDRASATGQPIKSIPAKGGSGKGNWGSDQEQIKSAITQHDTTTDNNANNNNDTNNNNASNKSRRRQRNNKSNAPDSFAALNPDQETKKKQTW